MASRCAGEITENVPNRDAGLADALNAIRDGKATAKEAMDQVWLECGPPMLTLEIPGRGRYTLTHLVLDVNGTIAVDGHLIPGVKERLSRLARTLEIVMVTADTYGRQRAIDSELEMTAERLTLGQPEAPQKAEVIRRLGAAGTVAIGNGANDVEMLKAAALSIAVLGEEGTSLGAVQAADVLARSIVDALDLLLHPRRLVATLRQ